MITENISVGGLPYLQYLDMRVADQKGWETLGYINF